MSAQKEIRPDAAEIVINGEVHPLRLTLGALAEIEGKLGGDFGKLQTRFENPRIADLVFILHALIGGGGGALTMEALKASDIDVADAARAIADVFHALKEDASNAARAEAEEAAPGKRRSPGAPGSGAR